MKTRDQPPAMPPPEKDEFLRRWSRRKLESETAPLVNSEPVGEEGPELATPPGDEDMPAISSLNEESDYSGFFSERVSEVLRQRALRKLFHSPLMNICDGLDDYAEDFTSFAVLGDIITSDMRHQLAMAEEKLKRAVTSEASDDSTAEMQKEGKEAEVAQEPVENQPGEEEL